MTISTSGIASDDFGQMILVTQGSAGYTLVADKKILFRLFLDLSATRCVSVIATVTYKILGFNIQKTFLIPTASLLIETSAPLGPSVGILFTGDVFPYPTSSFWGLSYQVDFELYGNPASVPHFKITELGFLPPGRLRLLIHNLMGRAPWGTQISPNFAWLIDMFQSLERLSAMLPVRDGLKLGLTHADAGLCYIYGDNIDTWPQVCPSGNPPPCTGAEMVALNLDETNQINASGTLERVDATVSWRPRDPTGPGAGGEGPGGKAIDYDSAPGKGLALVVGGNFLGKEFTGPIVAQEVGHLFGLEPPDSPHFQDPLDGLHSKDPSIPDPFAFDFWLMKPYQPLAPAFLGDVMNNFGGGLSQGRDMVLYNAFDWEHLRRKLTNLPGGSAAMAAEKPNRKQQDKVAAELKRMFSDAPQIEVANPAAALSARTGLTWHWTHRGFELAASAREKKGASRLDSSVEGLRARLEDLGIEKACAPIGGRPLSMVVPPTAYVLPHRKEFDVFDWSGKRPSGKRNGRARSGRAKR